MYRFKENFYNQLKAMSGEFECSKKSSLSSVLLKNDLRKLTEHNSHWMSHQERPDSFDFSDRFDPEEVEWRLNQPLNIIDGRTCVHLEVLAQRVQELASLMKLGGSPNVRDTTCGQSPLHYACSHKRVKKRGSILRVFLYYGGDLYQRDNDGKTPLSVLQEVDGTLYTSIVQDYLCTNCDIDDLKTVEKLHETVLHRGPLSDFKQLYSCLSHKNSRSTDLGHHTLLFRACKEGWIDGVSFILSQTQEVPHANQITNETPLHAACEGNHYEIVMQLITMFPQLLLVKDDLSYRGWYPIHTACAYGASDKILEAILVGMLCLMEANDKTAGARTDVHLIDVLGRSPLYVAAECNNLSHIYLMTLPSLFNTLQLHFPSLYAITSGNASHVSVIHCAILHDKKELLHVLLDKFPLAIETFAYPSILSMIHMLSHMQEKTTGSDNKLVIFPLLESTICEGIDGALVLSSTNKAFDDYGTLSNLVMSPLATAAAVGNKETAEMLLGAGAKDDDSLALRLAIFLQHHEIARMLLTATDDANICLGDSKKLSVFSLPSKELINFTAVDLQHNNLGSVPLALFQIPGLEVLNLSDNKLTQLPRTDMSSLDLPSVLGSWKCRSIKTLDISYNKLKSLPDVIWKLPQLEHLYAQHNSIAKIETAIEVHAWLERINISHNDLQSVPEGVFRANTVDVSHNKLKCLPPCIWKLDCLNNLLASNNLLSEIVFPKSFCNYNRARRSSSFTSQGRRKLSAEGNPSFFIHNRSNKMHTSNTHGLSKLDLSHNKLTSFPSNLSCFASNLKQLHISGNNISMLYICLLPACIKHLEATECNLDWIEPSYDNKDDLCCHRTHASLNSLCYLYLKGNLFQQFTFLNDSLDAGVKRLRYPELRTLDLSSNKLCNQLDPNIGLQKHLDTLILNDNLHLESLPLELSCLSSSLTHLELNNLSGLKDPPKEYISQMATSRCPKRLLAYMKSRIKSEVQYRILDLVIVGERKSGKTSLVKSLNRNLRKKACPIDEIGIYNWEYSPPAGEGPDVVFRIWDFPNQEYDTTVNYCFYSKQAIYLAVIDLTDSDNGLKEISAFLKNIKAHAPGCPVLIIGTHLDSVSIKEYDISQKAEWMYSDGGSFPKIASVCCISNTEHIHGRVKALRHKIYSVAMNIHVNRKTKLTLKAGKPLDDPDALLQQYIPQSYLMLQNEVGKKVLEMKKDNLAPMMNKRDYHQCFSPLFEDEEELASAVQFLHHKRKLLHFEDPLLEAFYFLDLQWIFNTMTNITKIPNSNGMILNDTLIAQSTLVISESLQSGFLALLAKFDFAIPCSDSHVLVHGLLPKQLEAPVQPVTITTPTLPKKSSTLTKSSTLEKLRKSIKKRIRSDPEKSPQLPDVIVHRVSDSSDDTQDDNTNTNNNNKNMEFTDGPCDHSADKEIESKEDSVDGLPDGFSQFKETSTSHKLPSSLPNIYKANVYHPKSFPQLSIVDSPVFEMTSDLSSPHEIPSFSGFSLRAAYSHPTLHPNLCRVWLTSFVPDGFWPQLFTRIILDDRIKSVLSTLLFTALKNNECTLDYASTDVPPVWKLYQKGFEIEHESITLLQLKQTSNNSSNSADEKFTNQIELTVHICNIVLVHKTYKESESHKSTENVIRLATSILVLIEQHILDIGEEWFPGVICSTHEQEVLSFVPCSTCLERPNSQSALSLASTDYQILCFDGRKAICFSLKDLLFAYSQPSGSIKCPLHDEIHVQQLAPDMCFKDLEEDILCGPDFPLKIDKDKELGRGGHALVLRGEILYADKRKLVAVKIISEELKRAQKFTDFLNSYTTSVKGYRMIRKEVLFLSTLCHENLTQLCGVSTHPFMILMELAPLGSLGSILKQYHGANQVLTPAVLQASMHQVASAMAFLHEKHVVYLDLKSDNVLVWKFPLPGHQNTDRDVLLKITDYGISRIAGAANEIRSTSINGTPGFIAPEVYTGKRQDLKSDRIDVFSFGMFLYELVTLLKPFELQGDNPVNLLYKRERPQIPKSKENFTPCLFQHIMKACWHQDPKERPSMTQVAEWSLLPELQSLRLQYHLNPETLLSVSQCTVLRDHVHQDVASKPSNIQYTIPNCESYLPLFSSISAQTPLVERKSNTMDHHSQVWIAQGNEMTILTFRSSDLGFYEHKDSTTTKVVTMENVGNYMWINTNDCKLYIVHTATMKTVVRVTLKNSLLEVVQLLHVPEWHMVLVLWELSEIWCLYDEVDASGVHVIGSIRLHSHNPIRKLCRATFNNTTEVWATRKDNEITILTEALSGCCETDALQCTAESKHATLQCNLISCLHFDNKSENLLIHVWVTFEGNPQLVCWNAETRKQIHSISLHCSKGAGENCEATSLLGHKNHLYVGTSAGTVEVFESETGSFLQQFSWHAKVNALLELPQEIKQSICGEHSSTKCVKLAHHQSFRDNLIIPKKRVSQELYLQRSASGSQLAYNSKSYKSGLYSTQQTMLLQDSPLIVSLGNDFADQLSILSSNQTPMHNIVELLTWTGL